MVQQSSIVSVDERFYVDYGIGKAWASAIADGDFALNSTHLRTKTNAFSPWGILCELYRQIHGSHSPQWVLYNAPYNPTDAWYYKFDGNSFYPPDSVLDWAQLTHHHKINSSQHPFNKIEEMPRYSAVRMIEQELERQEQFGRQRAID